nr:PREDICTED: protein CREG2 [Opisthocomus hoazin]
MRKYEILETFLLHQTFLLSVQGFRLPMIQDDIQIQGMPYGNCLLLSDGPVNNSTGIPFFYVTPKDNTVADLLKNPVASLTLPEVDGNFCRKNVIDPEDPRCARLTLTGQMVTVPPEEVEFAKQAMFSRHPVVRKWPRSYEWFFMKMNIEHIWLQSWYGEVSAIAVEEYLKAVPRSDKGYRKRPVFPIYASQSLSGHGLDCIGCEDRDNSFLTCANHSRHQFPISSDSMF